MPATKTPDAPATGPLSNPRWVTTNDHVARMDEVIGALALARDLFNIMSESDAEPPMSKAACETMSDLFHEREGTARDVQEWLKAENAAEERRADGDDAE